MFLYLDYEVKVNFEELDFVVVRKVDFLLIYEMIGIFIFIEGIWCGKGGKVIWEKVGLDVGVYVELMDYELEVKKSLYKVDIVYLYYLLFFGGEIIVGFFSDKLVVGMDVMSVFFFRFEFYKLRLEVDNLG